MQIHNNEQFSNGFCTYTLTPQYRGSSGIVRRTISEKKKFVASKVSKRKGTPLQICLKPCEQYEKRTISEANNTRITPVQILLHKYNHSQPAKD